MRPTLLSLALLASGCTCSTPFDPDAGPAAGPNDLSGDLIDRSLLSDGGVLERPVSLLGHTVTVLVEDAGTFAMFQGEGQANGTFIVRDVPQGRYSLQLGSILLHSDTRALHLGTNLLGRPEAFLANPGEGLLLTAQNLAPWTADDELQLTSWGAGLGYFSTARRSPPFMLNAPDAGATALTNAGLNLEGTPVVEAARGDVLTVLQLSAEHRDGGVLVKTARRAMDLRTTLALNTLTPAAGTFSTLPTTSTTLALSVGEFVKYAPEVGPGATPWVGRLYLDAHPGPFGRSTSPAGSPDLALVEWPPDAGDAVEVVDFGNPFPPPWTLYVGGGAQFDVLYSAALPDGGLASPRAEQGSVTVAMEGSGGAAPLTPLISPLRNVTVDGVAVTAGATISTTPVLAWDAPALGTVGRVELEFIELASNTTGGTSRQLRGVLRIIGPWQSLRLPPGLLNPGRVYFLRLTAFSLPPAYDREWPLLGVGPPAGAASTLTPSFVTQ